MLSKLEKHLTYANVVSTLCLFILLGGSAVAAVTLKRNSVKGKHIAKNAVTSPKVKNRSLLAQDFAAGQLPKGDQGPQGIQGVQGERGQDGANGSAVAYAYVKGDGTLDAAHSKNIISVVKNTYSASNPTPPHTGGSPIGGSYCIDVSVPVNHVVGSLRSGGEIVAFGPFATLQDGCPATTDVRAVTYGSAGGSPVDRDFALLLN
jgi:hypothetical protein